MDLVTLVYVRLVKKWNMEGVTGKKAREQTFSTSKLCSLHTFNENLIFRSILSFVHQMIIHWENTAKSTS